MGDQDKPQLPRALGGSKNTDPPERKLWDIDFNIDIDPEIDLDLYRDIDLDIDTDIDLDFYRDIDLSIGTDID